MGRKKKNNAAEPEEFILEPEFEEPAPPRRRSVWPAVRFTAQVMLMVAGVFGAGWAAFAVEDTIKNDSRFLFAPGESATEEFVTVRGLQKASRTAVLRVFAEDRDQSIARIPLDRRQQQLTNIEWVQGVTLRRVWPNRLAVDITERTPVAYFPVPTPERTADGQPVMALAYVDRDGEILRTHVEEGGAIPVLQGVSNGSPRELRRKYVRRLMEIVREFGADARNAGEIDLADIDNAKVIYEIDDREVTLVMGNERFGERLRRFLTHYPAIKDQLAPRQVLDLTVAGRWVGKKEGGAD